MSLTVLFILLAVFASAFTALMMYRAQLTQHETDQLFLDEAVSHDAEVEHDEIVRKVNFIHPFCQGTGSAAGLVALLIVGIYVARALPYVRF